MPDRPGVFHPNSLEDFGQRFKALAEEAQSYGVESVFCLHEHNGIENNSTFITGHNGSMYLALGLLTRALDYYRELTTDV